MTWHLQVLGVPQGLISGPIPSRLLESALLSQSQEPAKTSVFDLLPGNILTKGKLVGEGWDVRIWLKCLTSGFPEDRHHYNTLWCVSIDKESNFRLKCPLEGKQRRGHYLHFIEEEIQSRRDWSTCLLLIAQLLHGKGNSSDPVLFLIWVCSWSLMRLLLTA